MKVIIAIILAIGSVSARGSGPYLPSGWRPQGPAFFLPGEAAKPADSPHKEFRIQETKASGSDAFKEDPPKFEEIVLNAQQELPDVFIEQTFFVEAKNEKVVVEEAVNDQATTEQVVIEEVPTATEAQVYVPAVETTEVFAQYTAEAEPLDILQVEVTSEAVQSEELNNAVTVAVESTTIEEGTVAPTAALQELALALPTAEVEELVQPTTVVDIVPTVEAEEIVVPNVEEQQEFKALPTADSVVPTAVTEETVVPLYQQALVQDAIPTSGLAEDAVEVNNIADVVANLESEVKAAEILTSGNIEETSGIQETSGALKQEPEGFLEYGPPGFAEYGPPKEQLAKLTVQSTSANPLENNEVRRRRFSPRVSSPKKH